MPSQWSFQKADAIGRLTLVGETDLNLLHTETLLALADWLDRLKADEALKVLVLTGEGDRAFCAGADLRSLASLTQEEARQFVAAGEAALERLAQFPLPTVAAVNGHALGAGFELALCCDLRYLAEGLEFGQPAIRHGLVPPFGSTARLIHLIGGARARDLLLRGRVLEATEALEMGLASGVFSRTGFQEAVGRAVEEMARAQRPSLVTTKAFLLGHMPQPSRREFEQEQLMLALVRQETRQHIQAFLEENPT